MVEAYNHMNYDAIAIGSQDLGAGLEALQALAQKASFPFLSANLADHSGALLLQPVAYVERAGMRIALIGLTGNVNLPESCSASVKILPWQDVLPPIMATVSTNSDLVILLSNLSASENSEIAAQFADLHLIFQSGASKQNMRPQLINNTLITQAGHDGKYQGQISITWSTAKKWQQEERPFLTMQKEYDRLGWLISRVRKKGGPQVVYKDNKAGQEAFQKKISRYQQLEQELKMMSQDDIKNDPSPATYSNHFHPLPPSVPDDATIITLLQEARQKANTVRRQTAETSRLTQQYMGSNSCRRCHEALYLVWIQTPHASSYQTLEKQDQNNNLSCVYCHVTGLEEDTASLAASLPENLRAVGCEVCHGPGKDHAAAPQQNPPSTRPNSHLCTSCHSPERDDNFNFEIDKKKVH